MPRPLHILTLLVSLAAGAGCAFRPIFHPPTDRDQDSGVYTASSDSAAPRDSASSSDAGPNSRDFCDIPGPDGGTITVSRESGLCGGSSADASAPRADASASDVAAGVDAGSADAVTDGAGDSGDSSDADASVEDSVTTGDATSDTASDDAAATSDIATSDTATGDAATTGSGEGGAMDASAD